MIETDPSDEGNAHAIATLEFDASLAKLALALTPRSVAPNLRATEELAQLVARFGEPARASRVSAGFVSTGLQCWAAEFNEECESVPRPSP